MKRTVAGGEKAEDSEDEVDFMSDCFVAELESDSRPGIHKTKQAKREHELHKKKLRCDAKPLWLLEKETRNKGLSTPLDSSNKGFRMLQKMGFDSDANTPLSTNKEPLPLILKEDRGCLGEKRTKTSGGGGRDEKEIGLMTDAYKGRQQEKFRQVALRKDVRNSQKACYQLDAAEGFSEPCQKWFWPEVCDTEEPEEELDIPTDDEILKELTTYLRNKYCHCIWCGVRYNSQDDIASSCPGWTREDHA